MCEVEWSMRSISASLVESGSFNVEAKTVPKQCSRPRTMQTPVTSLVSHRHYIIRTRRWMRLSTLDRSNGVLCGLYAAHTQKSIPGLSAQFSDARPEGLLAELARSMLGAQR